ncbi:lysyl oxidase family protein [Actinophytocola sp. NPDC049390]|uniref:lysyl oxidase family protein n=1 Tax=Actinophytocola sp. NPDC049390 TaxID=3363894 RepID=UPI0037B01EFC
MFRRIFVAAATLTLVTIAQPTAAAAAPVPPDLGMARLTDLTVTTTAGGQQQLRFSSTVVNVGAGPFLVVGSRPDTVSEFGLTQRIRQSDGSSVDTPVTATVVFAGDGHGHWHVRDLETYTLHRLDTGAPAGYGAKGGFCFMDTTAYRLALPGAPQQAQYTDEGCGGATSTTLAMGLSVGWGDRYGWTLSDQYVDVTGIPVGKYRLRAVADAQGRFTESSRANNETWVDFSLATRRGGLVVKVLGYGPAA